jgi:hypothetical protein
MGMTALFAIILGSYLTMVEGQADSVARSQCYDTAIPVAEAGVEEAMSLINKYGGATTWTNNLTSDGWSAMTSSNTTTKSNLVFGANYYQVTISNSPGGTPTIMSAGVVPFIQHAWGAQNTPGASYASSTVALVRTLQIQTTLTPQLGAALEAKGDITFNNGANVDSFNSANLSLSSNGQYNVNLRDDKATVATDGNVVSSILGSGNVNIRGYVNTGPGGTIGASGNVSIGDMSWVNGGTNGVEPSRSNDDFNVTFPDVAAPTATFVQSPSPGVVAGTNYAMVFEGNQYWGSSNVMYQTSVQLTNQTKAIVTDGSVVLYVPSGSILSLSGQAYIYVAPGSSLAIYCGASSAHLSGQGIIGATNAANVSFYGLPTCTSIHTSGSSGYVGTIYAPEANFTGFGNAAYVGALMANSFTFNGTPAIHYDENLGLAGPSTGFVANNWREVVTPLAFQQLPP